MNREEIFKGLPIELVNCAEELAEHVHNKWAEEKIRQGWTYGPKRDDLKKESACLIPYDQLPEHEKNYDRVTAAETIRFLIENGYEITKE